MIGLRSVVIVLAVIAITLGHCGQSQANLVLNGDFSSSTSGIGQMGYNTTVTNWATTGYNFLFNGATADTTGSVGQYSNLSLWGPNNGYNNYNNLSITSLASPDGGNFIGADCNVGVGAITQTIGNLTKGQTYAVSFYWAAAQQYNFTGSVANTESWGVSLGGQTQSTATVTNQVKGFSGWMQTTLLFQADGTSDVLSFLAATTVAGAPPFVLLDGVSMNAVPEPSSLVLVGLGSLGFVGYGLKRRVRSKVA